MERKYWVPALERAHLVLQAIAEKPSALKLMDLSKHCNINKSTMFSLLLTMEQLRWVTKQQNDTYSLGSTFAFLGNAYFSSFHLIDQFTIAATHTVRMIGEAVQMAKLEQHEIVYLSKKEAPSPVRLISEPGMRMPAYATAMGKMLLSAFPDESIISLFEGMTMIKLTDHTISTAPQLIEHLAMIREQGFAYDLEEAVSGFCCVAAPIYDRQNIMVAAVSISMMTQHWREKKEQASSEIKELAEQLSGQV